MIAQKISEKIYAFEGSSEAWLAFEEEIIHEIETLSDEEKDSLAETEAMEHLLMVCEGIRFAKENQDERN